jgi:hypothetical protein
MERTAMTLLEREAVAPGVNQIHAVVGRVLRDFGRTIDLSGREAALPHHLVSCLEERLRRARLDARLSPGARGGGRFPRPGAAEETP